MAIRYYDDAMVVKLKKWIPEESKLRVLKPDESKRLFEIKADDEKDKPFKLPFIALSRNTDLELLSTTKQNKSFRGIVIGQNNEITANLNVIPIKVEYRLDIYTKTYDEGDEYLRSFLFKLINNPKICIGIPYKSAELATELQHVANIRVASDISDTSDIGERLFSGQFTRWTISLELTDAFLFSIPYRNNWKLDADFIDEAGLEITTSLQVEGETEPLSISTDSITNVSYEWSKTGNYRYCTATAIVNSETITEQVTAIYIIDQRATASRNEKGHFEASFKNAIFKKQILNLV